MDNAQEVYLALQVKPIKTLSLKFAWMLAQKGKDYDELGGSRLGNPFIDEVEWENQSLSLQARYQVINDGYFFIHYLYSNITGELDKYTPQMYHGKMSTLSLGANFGF
jgi:hypothetical protein